MASMGKSRILGEPAGEVLENPVSFVRPVDKLWRSLWVSLWESCGKVLHMGLRNEFCTQKWVKVDVFHARVEKFCNGFAHGVTGRKAGFCTVSTGPTITTIKYII